MKSRTANFINSKRFYVLFFILWAVALVFVLIWLLEIGHIGGELQIPVQAIQPSGQGPYGYVFSIGEDRLSQADTFKSPVILLEDDRFLGPGNAQRANISKLGGGRFLVWKGSLYFSSADHTDPRTNGRKYTLILPRPAALPWLGWTLLLMLIPSGWLVLPYINSLKCQIGLSPWQLLGLVAFGLAVTFYYFFHFLQNDFLDILLSLMILLHLWGLSSVLVYLFQRKFPQFGVHSLVDFVRAIGRKLVLHNVLIDQHLFYLCSLIPIIIFLITRLPFFIYYPIVAISPDTATYIEQVTVIMSGDLPLFAHRPPGYILFVWLITNIIDRWEIVIGFQSLLSLTAVLYLIYGVYSLRRSLSLPAALAMAGFLGSSHMLIYETAALSDSLYTTCLIFIFAFLLLGFGRSQMRYFIISSLFMGIFVSIRFAGMFMFVVYALTLLYMFINKYKSRLIFGFLLPLLIFLISWSSYNYFTLGRFNFIITGAYNTGGATVWFWEPDQSFPSAVNDVLRQLPSDLREIGITDADQKILRESWNPDQLMPIYYRLYGPLVNKGWTGVRFINTSNSGSTESIVSTVITTSIKKHPDLYAKFMWANLIYFYKDLEIGKFDFYETLRLRSVYLYTNLDDSFRHLPLTGEIFKEYNNKHVPDFVSVSGSGNDIAVTLVDTSLKRLHMTWQSFQWMLFQQNFWVVIFFVILMASTLKLIASKGKHLGTFVLFVLTITVVGASLVTCLSEPALERYAYPTEFIYFLSVGLLPLLWLKDDDKIRSVENIDKINRGS